VAKVIANVSHQPPDRLRSRHSVDVMVYILGILDLRGGSAYGPAKAVGRISSRIVVRLLWAAQHFQCYEVIQYVIHPMVLLPRTKITGAKMGRISSLCACILFLETRP
jgi:hypothetical protein